MVGSFPPRVRQWPAHLADAWGVRLVRVGAGSVIVAPARRFAIRNPHDAARFVAPYLSYQTVEVVALLPLDSQNRVITVAPIEITRGLVNTSLVHPREVFRAAIAASATSVIVAHNHPSGDPTPSVDDRLVTDQLRLAGQIVEIPLRDHVVVGNTDPANLTFVSFAEVGLI